MHNATNEVLFAKITIKVIVNPSARIIDHATACVMKKLIKYQTTVPIIRSRLLGING